MSIPSNTRTPGWYLALSLLTGLAAGSGATAYALVIVPPAPPGQVGGIPVVFLTTAVVGPVGVTIDVADARPANRLEDFRAVVLRNETVLGDLFPLSDAASSGDFSFLDLNGDGRFSGGDRFVVGTVLPGSYELILLWRDGRQLASLEWFL